MISLNEILLFDNMGHGIFPNYGMTYIKSWMHQLSDKEKKEVFFTSKQERAKQAREERREEQEDTFKKRKKK